MSTTVIDREDLMERIGGDLELLEELLELFDEDYPELLNEIRQAILQQNGEQLKRAAHTLKGAVGNFAAIKAHQLALALEKKGEAGDFTNTPELVEQLTAAIQEFKSALKTLEPTV